ncbi:MAG: helix-turn-helix domain-containing protein [Pseudomonadota bacterium]
MNTANEFHDSTREQLLDAAEALFVDRGVDNVSLRAIGRHAGQRNQSALQYHFDNRDGLLAAIMRRRMSQVEARRSEYIETLITRSAEPDLHDCCTALIRTPCSLCAEDTTFRDIFGLFGSRFINSNRREAITDTQRDVPSLDRMMKVIVALLSELPGELIPMRIEAAQSAGFLAISRRAYLREPFTGVAATLFERNLVDQTCAMLSAPVSTATLQTIRELRIVGN